MADGGDDRGMLDDLQLAAELGKTLLERNRELETALRHQQGVVDDQAQEIEYLTKQTVALKEVNDSRLRIYEQLEVGIQDLERANHRLTLDRAEDGRRIKSLTGTVDLLEARADELQRTVDDLRGQLEVHRRRAEASRSRPQRPRSPPEDERPPDLGPALARRDRKIAELEERLAAALIERERPADGDPAFGNGRRPCPRCLADFDDGCSVMDDDDDDDRSVAGSFADEPVTSRVSRERRDVRLWSRAVEPAANPYRDLVEKYEALLEVQRRQADAARKEGPPAPDSAPLSLQEELRMSGDFGRFAGGTVRAGERKVGGTSDLSEAETGSSGFSDETGHKATQTDRDPPPGSLLCDAALAAEGRFRHRPEYRELFREIFAVLKRDGNDDPPPPPPEDEPAPAVEPPAGDPADETRSLLSECSVAASDATGEGERDASGRTLTPLLRRALESPAAGPQSRKKSRHRNRRRSAERQGGAESPVIPSPPKIFYQRTTGNRRRRDRRPPEPSPLLRTPGDRNGPTDPPVPAGPDAVAEARADPPVFGHSAASQDLNKLRRLEMSYAEVLRNADKNKGRRRRHQ